MSDDTFQIEITGMAHGGSGLGRHDGRVVFIPYTIPGEIVEARLTGERGRVAFAEGLRLADASADRVLPRCAHFGPGRCGRCQWQHIDYPAQLLLKQDVLADQLARIGGYDDADVRPMLPSPAQWGYNYHMTLDINAAGQPGFMSTEPGVVMPIDECHILHPDLLDLLDRITLDFTGLARLRLQMGTDGKHMLVLWVEDEDDAPELSTDMPTSVNLILPDNMPVNLIGDSHSTYAVGGHNFRVTAGSAFRANIAQIDTLAKTVLQLLDPADDAAVLDLYGGVGVFSAYLAPRVGLVTMVESFPPAATDAEENLPDYDNVDLIEGTVEDVLAELEPGAYDAALLDPPSEGLSVDVLDQLGELAISRLVYASSDPATLARDAKRLRKHGYELGPVQPIDLNPQTYYIDAMAVFDYRA